MRRSSRAQHAYYINLFRDSFMSFISEFMNLFMECVDESVQKNAAECTWIKNPRLTNNMNDKR